MRNIFIACLLLLICNSCLVIENRFSGLPPGPWRGILKLELNPVAPNPRGEPLPEKLNYEFEEVTDGELPFNFEIKYPNPDSFYIELQNGEERIVVDDITIGLDRATAKDTVLIEFPVYNSYIRGIFQENVIQGEWVDRNRGEDYSIPFVAYHGENHRFTKLRKEPLMDITGKWDVTFGIEQEDSTEQFPAVGEFQQDGNQLTGTFLTNTGDYRYLEGTVQGNKLYLSTFDGTHAYLFEAKIQPDSTLIGSYRSGRHFRTLWSAKPASDPQLADPDALTFLQEGYDTFDFSFPAPDGEMVSPNAPRYQDKVKIIQIFGTWCPNCRDETEFLIDYIENNPSADLAVIGLAFEKQEGKGATEAIRRYKRELGVNYELLHAGPASKDEASRALPMLNEVTSFPTLIFLDRSNQVRRIQTGFAGPATSKYQQFKSEFESTVSELLRGDQGLQ